MKIFLQLIITSLCLTPALCFSYQKETSCSQNVLKQIYPNQNGCQLQKEIPSELQELPFVIYPTQYLPYNTERFNFNKRFNLFPKAIVIPESREALVKVFKLFRQQHLSFSIRSGGHCFEPGSLSSEYILDLRHFNTIKRLGNDVYIGAGTRLGPVIEELGKHDLVIPTGTCQSVGIGGLALGGGIGLLSRTYGLTCDAIKSITLLTADSKIIEVNKQNHADLFWALRGAGNGSYGIVLGFTFQTFHVPAASFFKLDWEWDTDLVYKIVQAWHQWTEQLPSTINPTLIMHYANGALSLSITGLKVGQESFTEWEEIFKPLNPKVTIQTGRYLDLAQDWADSPTAPFSKVKSIMAFEPLPDAAIEQAVNYLERLKAVRAEYAVSLAIVALGGQLTVSDTAFFPRKAVEWWHLVANWNQQDQESIALDGIRLFYDSVVPFTSPFCYSNSTDYDLGPRYLKAYYGNHVDRLIQIKRKYDPDQIFHWKQSIPTH
jgi:hypothetical protein